MRFIKFLFGSVMSVMLLAAIVAAQTAPPVVTPAIKFQPYLSSLSSPLYLTNAHDGTRRIFVVQQGGIIKVVQPNSTTPTDFMDITTKILSGGERGLLGLAFHPQFAANGYFFVNYTRAGDGATVIARYKTTGSTNALGDPNSERILLTIPQPFANHNGGMIEFRNDNGTDNLYIGMGDGGSANDPGNRAQNINELLGKMLRITPDVSGNNTLPAYTVPSDNPYVGINGADEIYSVGMRNPFRWSFDRLTKQLWAGDVGQGAIEEVDIINKGANYGWRVYEGTQCTNLDSSLCTPANYTPPIFQYNHTGGRCSITGGFVYRGTRGTLPNGAYTYADYCSGEVWMWQSNQQILLKDTTRSVSSFGEDEDGELYLVGLAGTVEKIVRIDAPADFDGDGKTDFSVFRPNGGFWYILNSFNNSFRSAQFGQSGDLPVPADYDGDNITDIAVQRHSNITGTGFFYYLRSSDNTFRGVQWGLTTDTPVVGDYDGDNKADIAVIRSGNDVYYILRSSDGGATVTRLFVGFDQPVPGDYDGDGKTDVAVWSGFSAIWHIYNSGSAGAETRVQFGIFNGDANDDIAAQGDYDGDNRTDIAVFRPSTGTWYIRQSSNGAITGTQFGASGDFPVTGDYDGDEKADIAVFRPSTGTWYFIRSSNGTIGGIQFGQSGDLPIPYYDKQN